MLLLLLLPSQQWLLMGGGSAQQWAANQLLPHPFSSRKPVETSQKRCVSHFQGAEKPPGEESSTCSHLPAARQGMSLRSPCPRAVPPQCHPQAASAPGTLCSCLRLNAHFSSSLSQLGLNQSWEVFYVCRNGKEMNAASPLKSEMGE